MSEDFESIFAADPASEFFLGNGFSVSFVCNAAFKSAALRLCVRTGSVDERALCGAGASHFTEHMVFNGAGKRDKRELASAVAAFGGGINAYTFYDRTVYSIDCPSVSVPQAVEILADMVLRPHMKEEDFRLEREIILREIDMCDDEPDELLLNAMFRKAYARNPLRFPIIGERAAFESLSCADLRAYMADRYAPCNMRLVVVANLPFEKLHKLAEKFFGGAGAGRCAAALRETEAPQNCPRETFLNYKTDSVRACLAYKLPPSASAAADAAAEAFAHTLADGNASVLVSKLKYGEGVADSVECEILRAADQKLLLVNWECAPAKHALVRARIADEIKSLVESGLSETQTARYARNCALAQANAMRSSSHLAEWIATLWLDGADFCGAQYGAAKLAQLSADEISKILKETVLEENSTYAALLPKRAVQKARIAKQASSDAECATLSNGLRVVFRRADFPPKLHVRLSSAGGLDALEPRLRGKLGLASLCILRDTTKRTAAELADFIEENALSFNSEFGNSVCSVFAESLSLDADKALGLVADSAISLKLNKKTFEAEKSALVSDIMYDLEDPIAAALRALRRKFFGKSPLAWHPDGDIADITKAVERDVENILKKNFCAQNSVLCISGNFEKSKMLETCESLFGGLPAGENAASLGGAKFAALGKASAAEVKIGKKQSAAFAAYADYGSADKAHYAARAVLSEMLGGDDGAVFERVREREGLSYSAGFSRIADFKNGMVYFYAAGAKKDLSRMLELFDETAQDFKNGRFEISRMQAAKTAIKARFSANVQDPAMWSALAAHSVLAFGEPITEAALEAQIDAVSAEDVAAYALSVFNAPLIFKAI